MAVRSTSELVIGILQDDYGAREDGTLPDLTPFLFAASKIVDWVAACATRRGRTLDDETQELIERWLAAHYYQAGDKGLASSATEGASASYQGQKGTTGLETTEYGKRALLLDFSGCLEALDKRKFAGATWLGKSAQDQIPRWQRGYP